MKRRFAGGEVATAAGTGVAARAAIRVRVPGRGDRTACRNDSPFAIGPPGIQGAQLLVADVAWCNSSGWPP